MIVSDTRRAATKLVAALALCYLATNTAFGAEAWATQSEQLGLQSRLEPRSGIVRIGEFQDWILTMTAPDGAAVSTARIRINGGMPSHGHGLPTQPEVTEYLGDGRYLVEGVRFNMSGEWILAFALDTPLGQDSVAFRLRLDELESEHLQRLAALRLDPDAKPPASISNRYADNPDAATLGESLFFDTRLSFNDELSCASCHVPERFYTDGKSRGEGVHRTGRNTPTVVGTGYQTWFYWDGRRDSLWSQALVPFEAPDEMGSSRVHVVRLVAEDSNYRSAYEEVFGELPELVRADNLPEHAGPLGTSAMKDAWYRIPQRSKDEINRVYVNLGKALEAYQRTLAIPRSRFDQYVDALLARSAAGANILTDDERAGVELWLDAEKTHCLRCHNGPRFTNDGFSNIGTGNFTGPNLDFGRVFGLRSVVTDEFNCVGRFSDAAADDCLHLRFLSSSAHVPLEGAFKVPSLRNIANTAPYMHDGSLPDLSSVIEHYRNPPAGAGGDHELVALDLTDEEAHQLLAFLETLSALPE